MDIVRCIVCTMFCNFVYCDPYYPAHLAGGLTAGAFSKEIAPWATGIPSSGLKPRPTKQPGPRSPTIAYLYRHARGLNAVARSSALSPEV